MTDRNPARSRLALGFLVVAASMALMFTVSSAYFIAAAYLSTGTMAVVAYLLTRYSGIFRPSPKTIAIGLLTAAALYLIFYLGNIGITAVHPLGISQSSESPIYALIASPTNPIYVQVGILAFDAVGYESFFRGVLQTRLQPKFGLRSVFLVALVDALIHVITLNPLWVVTTFIADSVWGLTYFYSKDLSSSMTSHFVWDIVIFLLLPIK
jgi:uncharacterized protein